MERRRFVTLMGTTGSLGTSTYLIEKNSDFQLIAVHPEDGAKIPGIRKWQKEYLSEIFQPEKSR